MRWGHKQQEIQTALTSTRVTPAPFWYDEKGRSKQVEEEMHLSRRSRLVEWLGDANLSKELLRRLGEVAEQQKLVRENPDAHWWSYRKSLRKQLQDLPRAAVQMVKAIDEKQKIASRKLTCGAAIIFVALGNAVRQPQADARSSCGRGRIPRTVRPAGLTIFARQETADLLARSGEDAGRELVYRLHVIFFAPTIDPSVRNVAKAVQTICETPRITA